MTSPTESLPWLDKVISTALVLRNLVYGDPGGAVQVAENLSLVVSTTSSVLQRLLIITNISKTLSRKTVVEAITKSCRAAGGVMSGGIYLPEVKKARKTPQHAGDETDAGELDSLKSLTNLLPSAREDKTEKNLGYAVVELRSGNQSELARQAICSNKVLKNAAEDCAEAVGVARVNKELLMEGTNELVAFAVFDEFLNAKLFADESKEKLATEAWDTLSEMFASCACSFQEHMEPHTSREERHKSEPQKSIRESVSGKQVGSADLSSEALHANAEARVLKDPVTVTSGVMDSPCQIKGRAAPADKGNARSKQENTLVTPGKSSPLPDVLTKEQICNATQGNLLLVFFSAIRHAKESVLEIVTQLLRDHGKPIEGDQAVKGLVLSGFVDWVVTRARHDARAFWKGILSCGYDFCFER